jgi:hypothetical protein
VICIEDSDSIASLLETEPFASNPNFTLYYDIAIESRERLKFQELVLDLKSLFPHNIEIPFILEFDNGNYQVTLLASSETWSNSQFIGQAEFFKRMLNEAAFNFPFRLFLSDNSTSEVKHMEIK